MFRVSGLGFGRGDDFRGGLGAIWRIVSGPRTPIPWNTSQPEQRKSAAKIRALSAVLWGQIRLRRRQVSEVPTKEINHYEGS